MVGKIQKIKPGDRGFPDKLTKIPGAPKQLFFIGSIGACQSRALSVVGSRKVSPYGRWATKHLVDSVAEQGISIISGLAYGVDSIAHQAALDNAAKTVAVLAGGLDQIYPTSHTDLAKRIVEQGGAIISEYEAGQPPLRPNFIARNRLIAGLGDAILITEAASKSGTLHTANFALDQGKSVLAVPGNINNSGSEGTNRLIQTGATPALNPEDILRELGIDQQPEQKQIFGNSADETAILDMLKSGATDSAELLEKSHLDAATFNQTMTMLEISGKIQPLGAGKWGLK